MKRKALVLIFILLPVLGFTENRNNVQFGLNVGYSNLTGSGAEYWKSGFHIGGNIYWQLNPRTFFGFNVLYNQFSPDEKELIEPYDHLGIDFDVSGKATFLEVVPTIKINLVKDKDFIPFIQTGIGLCFIKLEAMIEANYLWLHFKEDIDESEARGCFFGGFGFIKNVNKIALEIVTHYHITFLEGKTTNFITIGMNTTF